MTLQLPKKFNKFKPFTQQLKDGDVCDIKTGAKIFGYSEQHLRRLCGRKINPIPHIRRNGSQIFFTPEQIQHPAASLSVQ